mgnify:CR=1 FL=1
MRIELERRSRQSNLFAIVSPLLALALTVFFGGIMFALLGKDPVSALFSFFIEPLLEVWSLHELAVKAAPLILIGAGTGIGPLAGFVRANRQHRPMHLWFGARHPASDMLYDTDLATWSADGRLASLTTAFSRTAARSYVQDALRRDGTRVARLVAEGAQILVCGSRDMAAGVADALSEVLAPQGLTPAKLKAEGRYGEDVY